MKNVFVSRPTWIPPELEDGIYAFLKQLHSHQLKARTLGSTDYPSKCPLDEVIRIMNECSGLIVLGIPQFEINSGQLKGKEIKSSYSLGTEWNHIEAGLGSSLGLPILVIHHETVKRGIFDRGASNAFLYSIDMNDAAWPLETRINGALRNWKADVDIYTSEEKAVPDGIYSFDEDSGTLIKEGCSRRYCHPCTNKDNSREHPLLKLNEAGWECRQCGEVYENPHYNPPSQSSGGY